MNPLDYRVKNFLGNPTESVNFSNYKNYLKSLHIDNTITYDEFRNYIEEAEKYIASVKVDRQAQQIVTIQAQLESLHYKVGMQGNNISDFGDKLSWASVLLFIQYGLTASFVLYLMFGN